MKTTTATVITTACLCLAGGASMYFNFSGEEITVETGYTLFTPISTEAPSQKTILAPDGHKFSIALNLLEIGKLDDQYDAIVDEECTELDCAEVCTTEEVCTPVEAICTPTIVYVEEVPEIQNVCEEQPDDCENVETCVLPDGCTEQIECEAQNETNATSRANLVETQNTLQLEINSATAELDLDIEIDTEPYLSLVGENGGENN
jgi:hypothetical protein